MSTPYRPPKPKREGTNKYLMFATIAVLYIVTVVLIVAFAEGVEALFFPTHEWGSLPICFFLGWFTSKPIVYFLKHARFS